MTFDLSNPDRQIHAGVILVDSQTELLDIAPIDFLNAFSPENIRIFGLTDEQNALALDVKVHWVSSDGKPRRISGGLTVPCTDSFETCPPLDITLMGAAAMGYNETEEELQFIRKSYTTASATLFICGGFVAGLKSGIFKGKTCTAPRAFVDIMRKSNPEVNWVEKRWTNDGTLWTSGTLLNGTDMIRAFAEQTWAGERAPMVKTILDLCGWPVRDVDYKDDDARA